MNNIEDTTIIPSQESAGLRLDIFLSGQLSVTRSQVQKFISEGRVLVNGKPPKKAGQKVKEGQKIQIFSADAPKEDKSALPEVEVISETDSYLVVNKPAGLLTHPTEAREPVSLAAWLLKYNSKLEKVGEHKDRPGIVHRIDRDASGLLVVAKTQKMFDYLKKQFQNRTVGKEYSVLVHGIVEPDQDTIDFAIDRSKDGRMAARPKTDMMKLKNVGKDQEGKESLTEFWVKKRLARYTLLQVKIHTGRTHQIRVHMLAYNHPVVGDKLYYNIKLNRKRDKELGRLFLHSEKLCFEDLAGDEVCFASPLPAKLQEFVDQLN